MLEADRRKAKIAELQREILEYGGSQPLQMEQAVARLGVSAVELQERIERGEMIALASEEGTTVVPAWQFDDQNRVYPALLDLIAQNKDDLWGLSDKLTSPQPNSGREIPIEIMRAGKAEDFDYLLPE